MNRRVETTLLTVAVCAAVTGCSAGSATPSQTPEPSSTESAAGWAAAGLVDESATLVLQWVKGAGDGIFTQLADGTSRTSIVDLPGSALHPDFTSGGDAVAFRLTTEKDQIWVAGADGTNPTVLVACAEPECFATDYPAWSPDGTRIAFAEYLAPAGDNQQPAGSTLRIIDVTTGAVTVVATSAPGEILDNPRWSPDGGALVFQIDQFDPDGVETALFIATTSTTGGDITRITDGSMFGAYPDWSPAGDRIVFATYDLSPFEELPNGAASNLYTISPDGGALTALTDLPANGLRVAQPTWTLDGAGILVTAISTDGTRTPAVVPATGGDPIPLGGAGATHVREVPTP